MWYCYTIRKDDNFKHLSLITADLQEIYNFITSVSETSAEDFIFEIKKSLDK